MHTLEAVFTTLPKSFRQKVENFSLISDKKNKNTNNFFKKPNFFQKFPVNT